MWYNYTIEQPSSFQIILQVTFRSSAIWKDYQVILHDSSKINQRKGCKTCDSCVFLYFMWLNLSPCRSLDRELKRNFVRKLTTTAFTHGIFWHMHFLFILTVTLDLFLKVKTEFNLGYICVKRYAETWNALSYSRSARCKPGLGWKLSNFCSNIWHYRC